MVRARKFTNAGDALATRALVRERDRGMAAFKARLEQVKEGGHVKIGVLGGEHKPVEHETAADRAQARLAEAVDLTVRHAKKKAFEKVALPLSMVELATIHEFGAPSLGIPERSFLRAGIEGEREQLAALGKKLAHEILFNRLSQRKGLAVLGEAAKAAVQRKFTDGSLEPNRPSTIRIKGSSRPLIDSGQLRNSIAYEVVTGGAE